MYRKEFCSPLGLQESCNIANVLSDGFRQFTMEIIQKQLETAKAALAQDFETTRTQIIYGVCIRTLGLWNGEELHTDSFIKGYIRTLQYYSAQHTHTHIYIHTEACTHKNTHTDYSMLHLIGLARSVGHTNPLNKQTQKAYTNHSLCGYTWTVFVETNTDLTYRQPLLFCDRTWIYYTFWYALQ